MGYRVGRLSSRAVSSSSRSPGDCGFRGVFWVGRIFFVLISFLFIRLSSNAHGLLQVRAVPCLMYLSTSTAASRPLVALDMLLLDTLCASCLVPRQHHADTYIYNM